MFSRSYKTISCCFFQLHQDNSIAFSTNKAPRGPVILETGARSAYNTTLLAETYFLGVLVVIETVCVYAASSDAVGPEYVMAARQLGRLLAENGCTLVYGAGRIGLMGIMARAAQEYGGRVIGVIPEKLHSMELSYKSADELIVTRDLRERKAVMEDRADAFIALPGGFGTLEEIMEVLTLKQLWYHQKPLVFLNINGIYDGLIAFFDRLIAEQFIKDDHRELFHVCATPEEALEYFRRYQPRPQTSKLF